MPYNWKCCSFYPNNFGASALTPDTLLPLPWDNEATSHTTQAAHVPPVGKDEARERLVSLMKRMKS